jgi:hypothetical protein
VDNLRLLFANTFPMSPQDDRHSVYMYFQHRNGWQCQFLEKDLKTALPSRLQFTSSAKVIELVERGGGITDQESRLMLDQAIAKGRGGIFLKLTSRPIRQTEGLNTKRALNLMSKGLWSTHPEERRDRSLMCRV